MKKMKYIVFLAIMAMCLLVNISVAQEVSPKPPAAPTNPTRLKTIPHYNIPQGREALLGIQDSKAGMMLAMALNDMGDDIGTDTGGAFTIETTMVYVRPEGEKAIILFSMPFGYAASYFLECRVSRGEKIPINKDTTLGIIDFDHDALTVSFGGEMDTILEIMPPGLHSKPYEEWLERN